MSDRQEGEQRNVWLTTFPPNASKECWVYARQTCISPFCVEYTPASRVTELERKLEIAKTALRFYAEGAHQYREEWVWILADVERLPTIVNVPACIASGASAVAEANKVTVRSGKVAREALAAMGEGK